MPRGSRGRPERKAAVEFAAPALIEESVVMPCSVCAESRQDCSGKVEHRAVTAAAARTFSSLGAWATVRGDVGLLTAD